MFSHRWQELIERPYDPETIIADSQKLERRFWIWYFASLLMVGAGPVSYFMTLHQSTPISSLGLFLALAGLTNSVLIMLWAHIQISTLRLALMIGKHQGS